VKWIKGGKRILSLVQIRKYDVVGDDTNVFCWDEKQSQAAKNNVNKKQRKTVKITKKQ
jgi:hypothetical protein